MKRLVTTFLILLVSPSAFAGSGKTYTLSDYEKLEIQIPMRDGVKLFTSVYQPKEAHPDSPIIITRTPYGVGPYGEGFRRDLYEDRSWSNFVKAGYVIVFQDVRGRYLSEGNFTNIPPLYSLLEQQGRLSKKRREKLPEVIVDEATDTYDTVEWLVGHLESNSRVGFVGVSYPGYYATIAALCAHPAIVAVSPQAPVFDWFVGDDYHRNGVLALAAGYHFTNGFMRPAIPPFITAPASPELSYNDEYEYFSNFYSASELSPTFGGTIPFWNDVIEHPDYDEFWRESCVGHYVREVKPAILVVGGTVDAEDCYGAFQTYRAIKEKSPKTELYFALAPWSHGAWRNRSYESLGKMWAGSDISSYFLDEIEYPFFRHYLEGEGDAPARVSLRPYASSTWQFQESWPSKTMKKVPFYLAQGYSKKRSDNPGSLQRNISPKERISYSSYISDPLNPVPYMNPEEKYSYKLFMASDQSFASKREDVICFNGIRQSETLKLEGPVRAVLYMSANAEDVDLIVKLIDEGPDMMPGENHENSQLLIRSQVVRARFRNSLSVPRKLTPGDVNRLEILFDDIAHHIRPGHRLVLQIQSSLFPLLDRNPQTWLDNPYYAKKEDYKECEVKIYHDRIRRSVIYLPIVE